MHIVTTHKGTDFDALTSVEAVNLLFSDVVTVLPGSLNPNVRAFLSLHRDLFGFCATKNIRLMDVKKLTVVDTNRWAHLEQLNTLKITVILKLIYSIITAQMVISIPHGNAGKKGGPISPSGFAI